MSDRIQVGIVGCGNISQAYFNGCRLFPLLEVTACADLNEAAARKKAEENQVRALTVAELMQDPAIQIVINLTVPRVHAEISLQALRAGKHVHSEKPLGVSVAEGRAVVEEAAARKLRAGCAPDTFLGAGFQTCRKLVDDGWIGRPLAGTAFMMGRGPEGWHPNPAFFYEAGGGPMFDMGPYYLTALVHLLGPVKSVSAVTTRGFEERIATCKEQMGRRLPVQVPTHYSGTLVFRDGAVITVVVSFDVHRSAHRNIEIYGSDGSLQAPDPNTFGGPVALFRPGSDDWMTSALTHGYRENSRGIGVADMAHAVRSGRPHRCDARLALHVVEIMHAFEMSSRTGQVRMLETTCERPAPLPLGLLPGVLDD